MKNDRYCGENWLDEATREACEKIGSTYTLEGESVEFSPNHKRRMRRLFDGTPRSVAYRPLKSFGRVACLLIACTAITGVAMFGVNARRSRFLSFFIDEGAISTNFGFNNTNIAKVERTYSDDQISFDYLPSGFELEASEMGDLSSLWCFSGDDGYFILAVDSLNAKYSFDTENGFSEDVYVNEYEGFYIETPKEVHTLVWTDLEQAFVMESNLPRNIMMAIAKNVNKK